MGLASSTRRVPTTEPTIFILLAFCVPMPSAKPRESASDEVSMAVRSTPPRSTNSCKRSEEHTSELQSHSDLVCRLLLEKKKKQKTTKRKTHEKDNLEHRTKDTRGLPASR